MAWVLAGLGLVLVAELWRLHVGLRRLLAQVAVLTLTIRALMDKIDDWQR